MNANSKRSKGIRLLSLVALLLAAASAHATPPIEGQTIEFDTTGTVAGSSIVWAGGTASGDFDNDGDIDLVSVVSNDIVVWQNDGTPFGAGWTTSQVVGSHTAAARTVAVGDLDNDGELDIVSGGNDNNLFVWENDGSPFSGTWTGQLVGTYSIAVLALTVADLDSDGDLDIAAGDETGNIVVWQNNGAPFSAGWSSQSVGTQLSNYSVSAGDLDRDGDADLVTSGNNGIRVWENDGTPFTGTWSGPAFGNTGSRTWSAIGDLDRDGYLDIVSGGEDARIRVWQNDGTPFDAAWTTSQIVYNAGNMLAAIAVGDMDNDGDLDVLAGARSDFRVYAFQNDGTPFDAGSWANVVVGSHTNRAVSLTITDLDNDGDLDVSSGGWDNTLRIWENDAVHRNAPFADSGQSLGSVSSNTATLGDLDNDGDLDAFIANSGANEVWLNNGSGMFSDSGQSLGSSNSIVAALGDLDGDGDPDAFVTNYSGQPDKVWLNNGSGTFSDSGQSLGSSNGYDVALGDLDGDGDLDAFIANSNQANTVWMNNGSASFTDSGQSLGGTAISWGVALGDVDKDGDLDAFVANRGSDNKLWINDGSGSFSDSGQSLGGNTNSFDVALGDVDGDGDLDAYIVNPNSNQIWLNNGSGTFSDSGQSLTSFNTNIALGDLDGDGDLDAFTANNGPFPANQVWQNNGSGTFTDSGQSLGSSNSLGVALGDVDKDGDLDAFVANGFNQANEVWRNTGGSAFLDVTDTAPAGIADGNEDYVFQVAFTHNGIAADRDLELNYWNVDLLRDECATPLTTAEANAIIDNLRVRLDDGDGVFETDGSDVLVADVGMLALTGGVQQVTFADGDSNVQVSGTGSKTYWLSTLLTSDASSQSPNAFCLNIDPDADALAEGKTPDFSVSQQDVGPTDSGAINANPTAITLASFSAVPQSSAIRLDWETASELDNLGFNLHRSESMEGERVQLNAALIPGQNPGSPLGAVYTWLDEGGTPGVAYFYWLEAVDVHGGATLHGPVSATRPSGPYRTYLPLVGGGF